MKKIFTIASFIAVCLISFGIGFEVSRKTYTDTIKIQKKSLALQNDSLGKMIDIMIQKDEAIKLSIKVIDEIEKQMLEIVDSLEEDK